MHDTHSCGRFVQWRTERRLRAHASSAMGTQKGRPSRGWTAPLSASDRAARLGSAAGLSLTGVVLATGDRGCGTTDEEGEGPRRRATACGAADGREQCARRRAAAAGAGARPLAAVVVARASVVAAVAGVSTAVGALGDLEGILHGVITAGGGRCVGADIGRSVRRGAEDVDRGSALIIGLDCVLVGGDVDALRVDLEVDVLAGFAVLDRERDALIFVGEVRGLDRL